MPFVAAITVLKESNNVAPYHRASLRGCIFARLVSLLGSVQLMGQPRATLCETETTFKVLWCRAVAIGFLF